MKHTPAATKTKKRKKRLPIKHWSHSSLMAFLRNPLAWYKRYVEEIYDTPRTPAAVVGSAGHRALEYFYSLPGRADAKEIAIQKGLDYIRDIGDFEIKFGSVTTRRAKREKRKAMEADYLRAIGYYLARPPKHKVLGVEVRGTVEVEGLPLPIKAISDLVVASRIEKGAVDIVDHKFVTSFSKAGAAKSLFVIQAIFNYYTARELFGKPVRRFIVYECKKTRNADGSPQMRRYEIDFRACTEDFSVFHRLINDATEEIARKRIYLPNPSDMFEGDNSFDIYRLALVGEDT
ncbi:MAG TPA: PD-(D/E)XK nuclease family protein [Candidatus Paceibacterota bacterium]|nr:PD-(D/E)XK nuclease family protein [Candidatus Paceibacterota bacterium]